MAPLICCMANSVFKLQKKDEVAGLTTTTNDYSTSASVKFAAMNG